MNEDKSILKKTLSHHDLKKFSEDELCDILKEVRIEQQKISSSQNTKSESREFNPDLREIHLKAFKIQCREYCFFITVLVGNIAARSQCS